jgi:hypothetical protein
MTDRKRASMFSSDPIEGNDVNKPSLDLGRFQPQKAPEIAPQIAKDIADQQGFTTTHAAKPQQKRDGRRLKRSARSVQFNVRLRPEVAERFWKWAEAEKSVYADDFLEKLLELYERRGGQS